METYIDAENSPICVFVKCIDFDVDAIFVQGAPGSPGMPGPTGIPGKSGENGVPVSKYSLDHTLKQSFFKKREHMVCYNTGGYNHFFENYYIS